MIKNLLFAGKEFPFGEQYYTKALDMGITSLITKNSDDEQTAGNPQILSWNKGSVVSAHSLVIQAENCVGSLDAACLIFDSSHFMSVYRETDAAGIQAVTNDLILSYQLLCKAFMDRFQVKKHGRLVFVLKPLESSIDALKKNSGNSISAEYTGPYLSAAQSAFISFAENISLYYSGSVSEQILLIKAGSENDEDIAEFVCRKLSAEETTASKKKNRKDTVRWISVSGKDEGALAFFKRF